MHPESITLMQQQIARIGVAGLDVLDVGSYDVNGTYRPLIEERGGNYTGLDVRPGPNVDIVADDPYWYPLIDNAFDVVICGNTLHCVEHPWRLMPELARILKPRGLLAIVTIFQWGMNEYPVDYYRYTSNGLRSLFDEAKCLTSYSFYMDDKNTAGSAFKRG